MLGPIVQKCLQNTASELNSADVGEYARTLATTSQLVLWCDQS